jgi:hypothetical protein
MRKSIPVSQTWTAILIGRTFTLHVTPTSIQATGSVQDRLIRNTRPWINRIVLCLYFYEITKIHTNIHLHPAPRPLFLRTPIRNPPSLQRQRLQLNRGRLNEAPESHHPNNYTDDIHNIIPIARNIAQAAALNAVVLFGGQGA